MGYLTVVSNLSNEQEVENQLLWNKVVLLQIPDILVFRINLNRKKP
tara:strand:+ start:5744 stop:5881 length:138 start_codon:yes stop_codon:yes gene_type:complete